MILLRGTGRRSMTSGLVKGKEIEKAAGPLDIMHSKDSGELWNVVVDITVLPSGMLTNIGGGGEIVTTEPKWWLRKFSTVIGKWAQIHDSLWKTLLNITCNGSGKRWRAFSSW
jgi:hypothetical protein